MPTRWLRRSALRLLAVGVGLSVGGVDAGGGAPAHARRPAPPSAVDALRGGTFHLRFRETYVDQTNERRLMVAEQQGLPTFAADAVTDLWFTVSRGGEVEALRSRVTTVPDGRVWSETRYRKGDTSVRLRHYAACRTDELPLPPADVRALLRATAGPPGAPEELGYVRRRAGRAGAPARYELDDGPDHFELLRADDRPATQIVLRSSRDAPGLVLSRTSGFRLTPAAAAEPAREIGGFPCWRRETAQAKR